MKQFYVWDTPEVAKHFGADTYHEGAFYTSMDGSAFVYHTVYHNGFIKQLKEACVEYKLHPKHGFIPANSTLFNETPAVKAQEFPVVGSKVVIRNPDHLEMSQEAKKYIDKECTVVSTFKPSTVEMVVVQRNDDPNDLCVCFRADMCYPVPSMKEKIIFEMLDIICMGSGTVNQIAARLYEAGYRKTNTKGDVYE